MAGPFEIKLSEDHAERVEFIRRKKLELELIVASQTKANHWISREIVFEETKLWNEIHEAHGLENGKEYMIRNGILVMAKEQKEEP